MAWEHEKQLWHQKHRNTGQTACVFCTGPSIKDLPEDFRLRSRDFYIRKSIVFALNGAVLANACLFWDYFVAIDNRLANRDHYPGNLYYDKAMEDPSGVKLLPYWAISAYTKARYENPVEKYPNVIPLVNIPATDFNKAELYEDYPGYAIFNEGGVLGFTLGLLYTMGFRKIVLFGADLCKYEGEPHYFFGPQHKETEATQKIQEQPTPSLTMPGAVRKFHDTTYGKLVQDPTTGAIRQATGQDTKPGRVFPLKSPTNDETIYQDNQLAHMLKYVCLYIKAMQEKGCDIRKFTARKRGALDIPSITTVEELREAL